MASPSDRPARQPGEPGVEIELKFEVLDRTAPAALFEPGGDVLAGFESDDEVRARSVSDIYLDTAFGRLAAAGLAARIRSEMGRHVVTVKSLTIPVVGAVHRRLEVEGPALPTLVPATWPVSDARILVQAAIGGDALTVIARLRQQRRTVLLRRGPTVVELSLDDLEALGPPGDDRVRASRTELEAELLAGAPEDLAALGVALAALPGLRVAEGSKLEWARAAFREKERRRIRVIFVCTGNSARSQMAEAILRREGGDGYEVVSAGVDPKGVHPMTIDVLREVGIDISGARSKSVEEFLGQPFDYVITVCDRARESCPSFPGGRETLHWGFDDPAEATGTDEERRAVFRNVLTEIAGRIRRLVPAGRSEAARGETRRG